MSTILVRQEHYLSHRKEHHLSYRWEHRRIKNVVANGGSILGGDAVTKMDGAPASLSSFQAQLEIFVFVPSFPPLV